MVGDGKKVRFWEDIWFGTSPLAAPFWDLYVIVNDKGKTVSEIWDGQQINCTFRRSFSDDLMLRWYELEDIVHHINLSDEQNRSFDLAV